uniref:Uncharacterized protein n=1 Tax=Cannabis sativa TaxID=3483 RepID=A0A803RAW1_CANSA
MIDVTYLELVEYSESLPLVEKTIKATSASQSTEISCAFFNNPERRFENVTCLLILFSILFISTRPRPMMYMCVYIYIYEYILYISKLYAHATLLYL